MSFNLPANVQLPTSTPRHNLAIAEVVLCGIILLVQIVASFLQEWQQPKRKTFLSVLKAMFSWIIIFASVRIVGFTLYLAVHDPSQGVVVTEVILQSIGLSPLLLALRSILLRCGHTDLNDRNTLYPRALKIALTYSRGPIAVGVVLIIVAGSILNADLFKTGAIIIVVMFLYFACITIFILTTRHIRRLDRSGQLGMRVTIATLPFYAIRSLYLVLIVFGPVKFDPVIGDWRFLVGMGLAMEFGIVILLMLAGVVAEPLGTRTKGAMALQNSRVENSVEM